jgi:YidC/Oxa1 family membrane protein insertase
MENIRIFLVISLLTIVFLFFQAWERDSGRSKLNIIEKEENIINDESINKNTSYDGNIREIKNDKILENSELVKNNIELIEVKTDLFNLKITPKGGDIVYLEMNNYLDDQKKGKYVLFDNLKNKYVMQTGLISSSGPDSHKLGRAIYYSEKQLYDFTKQDENLFINLQYSNKDISVTKKFIFKNLYLKTLPLL